jgi:hypothetical protein
MRLKLLHKYFEIISLHYESIVPLNMNQNQAIIQVTRPATLKKILRYYDRQNYKGQTKRGLLEALNCLLWLAGSQDYLDRWGLSESSFKYVISL